MKLLSTLSLALAALSICEVAFGSFSNDGDHYQSNRRRALKGSKTGKNSKGSKSSKKIGAVYTTSNAPNNELLAFSQHIESGALAFVGAFSANGSGKTFVNTGPADPIASQDAVIVAKDCVLAVNAGSHTIASFKIGSDGFTPTFVDIYSSNGCFPVSLTEYKGLVYVLNAGEDGSISGYKLDHKTCALTPIPDSTVRLQQNTGLVGGAGVPIFASS